MDRRRRTAEERAATQRRHIEERDRRKRAGRWHTAAQAAHDAGLPVNVFITVSLDGLAEKELHPREAFTSRAPEEQEKILWGSLRRLAVRRGIPWIGLRAPELDRNRGRHVHIGGHAPDDDTLLDIVAAVARITGVKADRLNLRGFSHGKHCGVIALSPARAWMVQRDVRGLNGNPDLIDYVAKAAGKRRVTGQHRLSTDLIALVRDSAHRGALNSPQRASTRPAG